MKALLGVSSGELGPLRVCAIVAALMAGSPELSHSGATSSVAWPEIPLEEMRLTTVAQVPNADAVVLLNQRYGRFGRKGDDSVLIVDCYSRMKILSSQGGRYGELSLAYADFSRLANIEARTLGPDGTVTPVGPEDIAESVVGKYLDSPIRVKSIRFPNAKAGAILELRYRRIEDYLSELSFPAFFAEDLFVLRSRISQELRSDKDRILCDQCPIDAKPKVSTLLGGGYLYGLELMNIPGYQDEFLKPPRDVVLPKLTLSLLPSWDVLASSVMGRLEEAIRGRFTSTTKERGVIRRIKTVVDDWIEGRSGVDAQMRAVIRHVQDDFLLIPTLTLWTGPTNIDRVLETKTATGKDKEVLLLAALRYLEVPAFPAVVRSVEHGRFNPRSHFFSESQFTHFVVAIPRPDGTLSWVDPTVSYVPFGYVPWFTAGTKALLLKRALPDDERRKEVIRQAVSTFGWLNYAPDYLGEIVELPRPDDSGQTHHQLIVELKSDGQASIEMNTEMTGDDAMDMRKELIPNSEAERDAFLRVWLERRRPGASVKSIAIENLEIPERPLLVRSVLDSSEVAKTNGKRLETTACVVACSDFNPVSKDLRVYPFYVDRGWKDVHSTIVRPPSGFSVSEVPAPTKLTSALATFTLSCVAESNNTINCSRRFIANRGHWPASVREDAFAMYEKILKADRMKLVFEPELPRAIK